MKPGRALLSFNVVGMAPREAMLLKSFVRMLDGRTQQRWLFKPQQSADEQLLTDITFLGDEGMAPTATSGNAPATRQLRMGALALDLFAKLDRPLRPDELEFELNRMGSALVRARAESLAGQPINFFPSTQNREIFGRVGDGHPSTMWRPVAEGSRHSEFAPTTVFSNEFSGTMPGGLNERTLAFSGAAAAAAQAKTEATATLETAAATAKIATETATAQSAAEASALLLANQETLNASVSAAPGDELRLLRWPHASLISTPSRLKLAAFLVSSTTSSLGKLQETSGQPYEACQQFVQDLQDSGFLRVTSATSNGVTDAIATAEKAFAPAKVDPKAETKVEVQWKTNVAFATQAAAISQPEPDKKAREVGSSRGLFARIRSRLGIPMAG